MTDNATLDHDSRWFANELYAAFAPHADIAPSDWAEANLVLTSDFAAEPGNYSLDRTPWCRAPLDDAADTGVEVVIVGGASQTGKTQLSLAVAGYYSAVQPCSIMHVVPTDGLSETFSARFESMITASPVLRDRFVQARRTRAIANKHTKSFAGGVLVLASAASPTDLSSRPVKVAIADEIDRMGLIRKEGDPLSLIHARQQTFASRKLYAISTPTVVGASRVEQMIADATSFEWHSRCEHCGDFHGMSWPNAKWELGGVGKPGKTEDAVYVMPCCGAVLNDAERWRSGAAGKWVKVHDGKPGWKAYRFNGLVSPWVRLAELASQFEAARGTHAKLQPFFNLKLGVAYESDVGEGADADVVTALAENFKTTEVPLRAVVLTCGVDVQDQSLFAQVVAWGEGSEGWTLGWYAIPGDTNSPSTWAALEEVLLQKWRHASGEMMGLDAVAIDSGGHRTPVVYDFCRKHSLRGRSWYAVKGDNGAAKPWMPGGDKHRSMAKFHLVRVDQFKDQIASGLVTEHAGPGKLHVSTTILNEFPDWVRWATAEEAINKDTSSGTVRTWRKRKGEHRNESFDCLVYAAAVSHAVGSEVFERRLSALAEHGSLKPKQSSWAELGALAGSLSGAQ